MSDETDDFESDDAGAGLAAAKPTAGQRARAAILASEDQQKRQSRLHQKVEELGLGADFVQDFIGSAQPADVDTTAWVDWLYPETRPHLADQKSAARRKLDSSRGAVSKHRSKVATARAALALEEEALAKAEAKEAQILGQLVLDRVFNRIRAVFAMGPAWTIMRVLSPAFDPETGRLLTVESGSSTAAAARNPQGRAHALNQILMTFDRLSGNIDFENDMRKTFFEATHKWQAKVLDLPDGSTRRNMKTAHTTVNPKAVSDANQVLDGFVKPVEIHSANQLLDAFKNLVELIKREYIFDMREPEEKLYDYARVINGVIGGDFEMDLRKLNNK